MKFIADFHIHSHYSIATSKNLNPEFLNFWAKVKGVNIVASGDFTHPAWLAELKKKLEPAEQGLYRIKSNYKIANPFELKNEPEIRFILSAEISTIYKKHDKVRKVHHVLLAPDFATVEKIQYKLQKIGNITSDGRPILGLDSRNLLEICLESGNDVFLIPAHIWTPWFSALGDKSGFETIKQCYDDLSRYIYAIETGLSSDPPMNWMCSFLDEYTIVSNSDAHSPEKLGREANIFDTEISYSSILNALKDRKSGKFLGTIEFFPQEGKYHYDGHRKCNISWKPTETIKHKGICPVCGKKVTVGVMNRIFQLADRKPGENGKNRLPFHSVIPLKEILSEILSMNPTSKKLCQVYYSLLKKIGSEIDILLNLPLDYIRQYSNELVVEALRRMRNNEVYIKEGFDGEYGQIKVFAENEHKNFYSQTALFNDLSSNRQQKTIKPKSVKNDLFNYNNLLINKSSSLSKKQVGSEPPGSANRNVKIPFNDEQKNAIDHVYGPGLVIAGPGTGKTRVLTHRIFNLIKNNNIAPDNILAVTFTNKAANEMKNRLELLIDNQTITSKLQVSTFHAFGHSILHEINDIFPNANIYPYKNFTIIDTEDKNLILNKYLKCDKKNTKKYGEKISALKQDLISADDIQDEDAHSIYVKYEQCLKEYNLIDLDDLIFYPVKILETFPEILSYYQNKFNWILIDEYQDINTGQYQLIKKLLPETNPNLFAIGDPDQAIYGFRGANVQFINRFCEDFPNTTLFTLNMSYRCSTPILRASHNVLQSEKVNLAAGTNEISQKIKIMISKHHSDKSEAEYIARTIEQMIGGLRFFSIDSDISEGETSSEMQSLSDFAILCRTNKQISTLEKALNDHCIPYQTIGDIPFFKLEPVNTIIDILKLLLNPESIFIKEKLLTKQILNNQDIIILQNHFKDLKNIAMIIDFIIQNIFKTKKDNDEETFKILRKTAMKFENNIQKFIQYTDLGSAIDTYQPDLEKVSLMTLHAAKGLEFPCVFISGCEEGLIPYSLFFNQKSDINEERRILYVGMTRAKKYLYLTYANKRLINGRVYHLKPSTFLKNIEQNIIEYYQDKQNKNIKGTNQLSLF